MESINSTTPTFKDALEILQELSKEYGAELFKDTIKKLNNGQLTPDESLNKARILIKGEKKKDDDDPHNNGFLNNTTREE